MASGGGTLDVRRRILASACSQQPQRDLSFFKLRRCSAQEQKEEAAIARAAADAASPMPAREDQQEEEEEKEEKEKEEEEASAGVGFCQESPEPLKVRHCGRHSQRPEQ